ncbi:hypothetical protein F2Q69_00058076 [Brassica cretica]|uniref:Uncharacterized protein n=1 Tax=Brassica cretica TaxID=69181 RepID=A0A8S9N574_BRACR|nr:hypothetical protein F2Q69_00058076 [Brassica cretica]
MPPRNPGLNLCSSLPLQSSNDNGDSESPKRRIVVQRLQITLRYSRFEFIPILPDVLTPHSSPLRYILTPSRLIKDDATFNVTFICSRRFGEGGSKCQAWWGVDGVDMLLLDAEAGLEKHWEQPRSFIAGGYAKVEPLSISELNEFVITAEPQEIEFVYTGMVSEIKMDKGWCYVSCSRYRVEMSIADDTDEGLFVAFDGVRSII